MDPGRSVSSDRLVSQLWDGISAFSALETVDIYGSYNRFWLIGGWSLLLT